MAAARLTVSSGIARLKASAWGRPRMVAHTLASSTAMTMVFTPPAVEPGEPPMNMRNMSANWLSPPSSPVGTVSKPAVRAVTERKCASARACVQGSPPCEARPRVSTSTPVR